MCSVCVGVYIDMANRLSGSLGYSTVGCNSKANSINPTDRRERNQIHSTNTNKCAMAMVMAMVMDDGPMDRLQP